jgi:hypothetical protein
MISVRTSRIRKEDVFGTQLNSDSRCSKVVPRLPDLLSSAPRCFQTYYTHCYGIPIPVIRDPSYSQARQESPPRVRYSPEIAASKFTIHILSDTAGGFQRPNTFCRCNILVCFGYALDSLHRAQWLTTKHSCVG